SAAAWSASYATAVSEREASALIGFSCLSGCRPQGFAMTANGRMPGAASRRGADSPLDVFLSTLDSTSDVRLRNGEALLLVVALRARVEIDVDPALESGVDRDRGGHRVVDRVGVLVHGLDQFVDLVVVEVRQRVQGGPAGDGHGRRVDALV